MLAGLLGMCALIGVDALQYRTPRKPFSWKRPDLEWWTTRRTKRERIRSAISMSSERTAQAQDSLPKPASSSQAREVAR